MKTINWRCHRIALVRHSLSLKQIPYLCLQTLFPCFSPSVMYFTCSIYCLFPSPLDLRQKSLSDYSYSPSTCNRSRIVVSPYIFVEWVNGFHLETIHIYTLTKSNILITPLELSPWKKQCPQLCFKEKILPTIHYPILINTTSNKWQVAMCIIKYKYLFLSIYKFKCFWPLHFLQCFSNFINHV